MSERSERWPERPSERGMLSERSERPSERVGS
jgi:hypothetical protein